jgi:hypothetical protein
MADMVAKGRQRCLRGEQSGSAKLTEVQVRAIRLRLLDGEAQVSLAREYGVNKTAISKINLGRRWRHA